ncbi:nickel pincer cofactor biosynthesis protein LarC [Cryptosporangium aurantiacum]|uniref:Pyridinium-3,5-bisthiocarboxylic acid mononucleotide nickel insertion protein n=1 Tax=Cryptosporangium aurantiacum TaxID=134849 RepID=A0A1M7PEP0_9ACTN|nr:nickel pincer cofactor biosynthesis protein LarC [Cryptosporangium aurantiacum]SHN15453.1 hypothetical protein SAMN05443668_103278 [Cryptosporangium aurantiacum]
MSETLGWLDASGGISGDMLLGACLDAGVEAATLQAAVDGLHLPERVTLRTEEVRRAGLRAARVHVDAPPSTAARRLGDILGLLADADLHPVVRGRAADVFTALGAAEARVHGRPIETVHFHEVGALDSLADIVGAVAGLHALGIDRLICSPIAVGSGRMTTAHGDLPVPGPAVLELLRAAAAPATSGSVEAELATPTGVAVATTLASGFGAMPGMTPATVGVGAGRRDPVGHPNVTRLVVGRAAEASGEATVLESNVDDLDPRLWPPTLAALLAAGASDAWLTPILMKKGRPAHTVSVLCRPDHVDALLRVLFRHTSTIGVRKRTVTKAALDRTAGRVEVAGHPVRTKIASLDGEVLNVSVEYEDVLTVAAATGLPPKVVLATAEAQCAEVYAR